MQNRLMKHLHSREAATGGRTYENHALNPLLEQTFRSYASHCWAHNLCFGVNTQKNVGRKTGGVSSGGCGCRTRRNQVKQVSDGDLMERFLQSDLEQC